MWFFTYFSVTYFTTSYLSFVYDAVIGGFKHHDRTREEVVRCAKEMTPHCSIQCVRCYASLFVISGELYSGQGAERLRVLGQFYPLLYIGRLFDVLGAPPVPSPGIVLYP